MQRKSPFFKRSPRLKLSLPTGRIVVHRPKTEPMEPKFSIETMIIPIFLTVATVGIMFWLSRTMAGNSMYPIFILAMSIPMIGSYIATIIIFFRKKKTHKAEIANLQAEYLEHVEEKRIQTEAILHEQGEFLRQNDPNPKECLQRIDQRMSSLWERTPTTEDFLDLRIGLGKRPFKINIQVPNQEGYEINPLIAEAERLATDYLEVKEVPVTIPLQEKRVVGLVGEREEILNLVRILTLQLATHHSPEEVKLVASYSERESDQWSWMRWLPHAWSDDREARYMAEGKENSQMLFEKLYSMLNIRKFEKDASDEKKIIVPEYVFFISQMSFVDDDPILPLLLKKGEETGACTFLMSPTKEKLPMECELIIEVNEAIAKLYETFADDDHVTYFTGNEKIAVDGLSLKEVKKMARTIAPLKLKQSTAGLIPKVLTFLDMYEVNHVEELEVIGRWGANRYPTSFPVPIGVREGGKQVFLNIHDKINKGGHGPHGLMAGTTGSGKSEVIQSLILSLAVTYHPHEMAFMLIDYKGGGMSNTFKGLPHVVASITNLEDPNLIQRAKVSLRAELERRQKLFNEAGNIQHIDEYFTSEWRIKEPLPHLFIVIDEFAQLKKDQPEFMDELISIAAIGRTLGVHLLLATQKPAGVVDEKIWSNSRFRVCLRVQDESDSREMIKIPNAADINVPGRAYLQVGNNEVLEYFQSAWSGATYAPTHEEEAVKVELAEVRLDGTKTYHKPKINGNLTGTKEIETLIEYISKEAEKAGIKPLPGPWQEPLPTNLPISKRIDLKNWTVDQWEERKDSLYVKAGLVDDVANQVQYPLSIDLEEGHFVIYGMPGAGKTTFLQSSILWLVFHYSPKDVNLYMIDFSRQFRGFSKFPHVGEVVSEEDTEKMKRLFKFLGKEISNRKEIFGDEGVNSLRGYRSRTGKEMPAIIVAIDGYITFKSTFPNENEQLEYLLREGANYGIYFIVTANQTSDLYDRYRNNFASAVSFELADHTDYYFAVGRPDINKGGLPEGRGFVKGNNPPLSFQAMLPYDGEELEKGQFLRGWTERMTKECSVIAQSIPLLPKIFELEEILLEFPKQKEIPVGLEVEDLHLLTVNLDEADHVFITGRVESGKTSLLKTTLLSTAYQYAPNDIDFYLIELEPKRDGILNLAPLPHVDGYATSLFETKDLLKKIVQKADERKGAELSFDSIASLEQETHPPIIIAIDDTENFMQQMAMDFEIKDMLEKLTKEARQKNIHFILAGTIASMNNYMHDNWFANIKKKYLGFLLGSTMNNDLYFFNMRLPHAETDQELPAGDGYMIKGRSTKMKAALPYLELAGRNEWLTKIKEKYVAKQVD